MLEITDRAIDELAQVRAKSGLGPDHGVGIVPQADGRLGFAPVQPSPPDQVIEREGQPVVVVPAAVADELDGLVLDYRDEPGTPQFTLTRPEAEGSGATASGDSD